MGRWIGRFFSESAGNQGWNKDWIYGVTDTFSKSRRGMLLWK